MISGVHKTDVDEVVNVMIQLLRLWLLLLHITLWSHYRQKSAIHVLRIKLLISH